VCANAHPKVDTSSADSVFRVEKHPGTQETGLSTRRNFAWGRWIRVSVAHHYLQVDKAWFAKNVRPHLSVMQISRQAKAYRREDLDARAAQIECELLRLDATTAAGDYANGDVRSPEKGVNSWAAPVVSG